MTQNQMLEQEIVEENVFAQIATSINDEELVEAYAAPLDMSYMRL